MCWCRWSHARCAKHPPACHCLSPRCARARLAGAVGGLCRSLCDESLMTHRLSTLPLSDDCDEFASIDGDLICRILCHVVRLTCSGRTGHHPVQLGQLSLPLQRQCLLLAVHSTTHATHWLYSRVLSQLLRRRSPQLTGEGCGSLTRRAPSIVAPCAWVSLATVAWSQAWRAVGNPDLLTFCCAQALGVYTVYDDTLTLEPSQFYQEVVGSSLAASSTSYLVEKSVFVSTGTNWTVDMSSVPAWVSAVTPLSG